MGRHGRYRRPFYAGDGRDEPYHGEHFRRRGREARGQLLRQHGRGQPVGREPTDEPRTENNMKFTRLLKFAALAVLACGAAITASAQGRGFDLFGIPRPTIIANPSTILVAAGAPATTNGPIDIHMVDGVATIDLYHITNTATGAGTLTATLEQCSDNSTWAALSNYALMVFTNQAVTNMLLGTNYIAYNTNGIAGDRKSTRLN